MLELFYPDEIKSSAYTIDYLALYNKGYRGILFDIDNTLVPHGEPADGRAKELFGRLREIGFDTCLISNNKIERVLPFAESVGSKFVEDAGKPSRKGYIKAMKKMRTRPSGTVFIGDQLFTDVCGAKRCGIHCILTKPIDPKEEIQIVLKRYPEKLILSKYARFRSQKE